MIFNVPDNYRWYSGIYSITNKANGRIYIGKAIRLHNRYTQHLLHLKKGCHSNRGLQEDYIKYGANSFEFGLVEHVESHELLRKEAFYIQQYNSTENGYNSRTNRNGEVRVNKNAIHSNRISRKTMSLYEMVDHWKFFKEREYAGLDAPFWERISRELLFKHYGLTPEQAIFELAK